MPLFLSGISGAGKTRAIRDALADLSIAPRGFWTQAAAGPKGERRCLLRDARGTAPARLAARRTERGLKPYPEAFDELGASALWGLCPGDRVVMDELGFLEASAQGFQDAVLQALAMPCRTVGVLKRRGDSRSADCDFLDRVRSVPCYRERVVDAAGREAARRLVADYLKPRRLFEALALRPGMVAIIGGGGKTSLMLGLAQELRQSYKVIVTTSTHIYRPEGMACLNGCDPGAIREALARSGCACVGEEKDNGKYSMPKMGLEPLMDMADYILVEADGSKGLPLKAHAAHEPAIPDRADRVIGVVGAKGFFRPIREAAHRPDLYASSLGVDADRPATPADAARLVARWGADAVLVNQVDGAVELSNARAFARRFCGRCVMAALRAKEPVLEIWRDRICLW